MYHGATALTRMPSSAHSQARLRVSCTSAALVMPYGETGAHVDEAGHRRDVHDRRVAVLGKVRMRETAHLECAQHIRRRSSVAHFVAACSRASAW